MKAFRDHLQCCVGVRNIPLAYVVRPNVAVTMPITAQITSQPYTEEHGSIEDDMVARASHNHGLFKDDNASVYYKLEEATRSTTYAASIQPFQKRKNRRAAFEPLTKQYAGADK